MTSKGLISAPRDEEPLVRLGDGAIDRMPGLSAIFTDAGVRFGKFLADQAEGVLVEMEDFSASRLNDLAERYTPFGSLYAFRAVGAECRAVAAVDGVFRDLVFEILLGSGVIEIDAERPATCMQERVIAHAALEFVTCFARAFAPFGTFAFVRDAAAEEAGFLALGGKAAVIITTKMTLQYGQHEARLLFALPRSALDPYRVALSQPRDAVGKAADEKWSENLYDNLLRTEVKAEVRIEAKGFTLGDIVRLEVGDVLRLPTAPTDPIRVVSENRTLFWCVLGQKDGLYTVRLEDFSDDRESYIENILGV